MLRYVLTEDDVGSVRFGISPLCELGLSLRAIRDPARFPLQLGWLRRTEEARTRLDLPRCPVSSTSGCGRPTS